MENTSAPETEIFTPDKLKISETLENIRHLNNGDLLFLTHNSLILKLAGKNILIDPSFDGRRMEKQPDFILPGKDGFKNFDQKTTYPEQVFDTKSPDAARLLAPEINYIFVSHADPDHMRASTLKAIIDRNPEISVFFPTGIIPELQKVNGSIPSQMHEVTPQPTHFDPAKRPEKNSTFPLAEGKITVTSFEVQHTTRHNQGLFFESEGQRILVLSDAGLSPELLKEVDKLVKYKPLTRIIVSTAKYNPLGMYGKLDAADAKKFRDEIEEQTAHSAYLPIVLLALTSGLTPIDIIHQGFYHNSKREMKNFSYRIPTNTETNTDWVSYFKDKIYRTLTESNFTDTRWGKSLKKLVPLTGKTPGSEFHPIADNDIRWRFSRRLRRWLDLFRAPQDLVDSRIHMPGPNEIVHN
jgi:L-ascorbate metabolism protein UlaG (beta-lactamase superfamily)